MRTGLGAMRKIVRAGAVALAVAFLLVSLVPLLPSSTALIDEVEAAPSANLTYEQYDPAKLFQVGTIFGNYSSFIQVEPYTKDFAIGDLNGDGISDLAAISNKTNAICIYNRTASGTLESFPLRILKSNMVDIRAIAIGDLNNDDLNDIAVTYNGTDAEGYIGIFFQDTHFSSSSAFIKRVSSEPMGIYIGKFDGSPNNSVATVSMGSPLFGSDDYIDIWKQPFISSTFDKHNFQISASPQFTRSRFLTAGDVNGDGRTDLIVGNDSGNNAFIALQPDVWKNPWIVLPTKSIPGSCSDLQMADIFGNGVRDLVFADSSDSSGYSKILVYKNLGTNFDVNYEAPLLRTPLGLGTLAFGEFSNGQGMDILSLSKGFANASAFIRGSESEWYSQYPNFTFPVDQSPLKAIADSSIGGVEGIFILCQGLTNKNGSLAWYSTNPMLKGNSDDNQFSESSPTSHAIGRLVSGDLVIASTLGTSNKVWLYSPNGSISRTIPTQVSPIGATFGRFDADDNDDLAILNAGSHSISIYKGSQLSTATSPFKNITLPFTNPKCIASLSIQNSQYSDIFVGYGSGGFILYNTEDSQLFDDTINESMGTGISGSRDSMAFADFDNDGASNDIALMNVGTKQIEIYLRSATGSLSNYYPAIPSAYLSASSSDLVAITSADLGGSSASDVAAITQNGNLLIFLQPIAGFTDTTPRLPDKTNNLGMLGGTISSGDINDDGLSDLLISDSQTPRMTAYLRIASATFKNTQNFTTGAVAVSSLAQDLNGDARIDLSCVSTQSHSLSIWFQTNLAPFANATASTYSAPEGVGITFSGLASTDSYSDRNLLNFTWTFAPGVLNYNRDVTYAYLSNGTKVVSLKVTDRSGLSSWSNISVKILDKAPIASFTYSPSNPFENSVIQFVDTSASSPDPIVNWTWNFGDSSPLNYARNPAHTYISQGPFGVVLQVRDSDGSTNTYLGGVVVADTVPNVSFTQSSTNIVEGGSVVFTSTSTVVYDSIVNYTWNFDDGSFGYAPSLTHIFINNGTYHVSLTIRDSDGSTNSTSTTIQVQDTTPTANFDFSPNNAPEGSSVSFIDTSTGYDTLVNWTWNFGDGSYGYGADVDHVFLDDGSYLVTLTVRDSDGSTDSASKTVTALDTSPIASYAFEPSELVEGVQINFTSTSTSFDPLVNWTWDISTAKRYGPSVNYEFLNSGSYTVKLTVRDSDGSTSAHSQSLVVSEAGLDTNFTIEPSPILEGMLVHFNDTSFSPVDPLVQWDWGFGDGSAGNGRNVTHIYMRSGTFLVNLTVTDSDGSLGFWQKSVQVIEVVPVPSFTIEPSEIVEGKLVFFNATAITFDPITSWSWRFSDDYRVNLQNVSHAFGDGLQWANLTVRDSDGTANYLNLTFVVIDSSPIANFDIGSVVEGQSTSFIDNSTKSWEDIVIWYWDFGDSSPVNYSKNPTHTYLMGGSYRVNHTVWDADGNSNSVLAWIDVERVLPRVSFTITGSKVEGQILLFTSNSQSYNPITSIKWSFDDGSNLSGGNEMAQVEKTYASGGRYNVTLTIQEADGDVNSSTVLIIVHDTSPTIKSFSTIGGGTRFSEYDQVWFQMTADPGYDPLFSYSWDFEGAGVYIPSDPLLANISSYRYTQSGVYLAKAMVQDSDGSKVYSLSFQIVIDDVPPVAKFTWYNDTLVSGMVWFNASTSSDTPNDLGTLRYSWDFGDGNGINYNYNYLVSNTFLNDGTYTITLIVKDNDDISSAPATIRIVVDRMEPDVIMEQDGMNATVGEPIHIAAKVTDPGSGVKSVTLLFRIGDGPNQSMPMTPSQSPNLYTAVIAAQENATTITYRILVEDNANNEKSTQEFTIQVAQPNNLTTLIAVGLLAAVILILIGYLIGRQSVAVDEVFIIYQDGRLMAHQTRRLKPGMDDEILSSMLIAIQSFVKDSFKDESSTHLQRLDFGEKKILVERGDSFYLAVVLHSNRAGNVPKRMQAVIADIHKDFGASLQNWDGDLEKVRGIKDRADRLFKASMPLAIADTSKPRTESSECPMCGSSVNPNDNSCPSCGTELSMSTVDDLETVAKDLEKEKEGKA